MLHDLECFLQNELQVMWIKRRPKIVDGTIFRNEWIHFKRMPKLSKYDELICYTDPSFKSTTANDYKASRLWGKIGPELHLIDCYVRQDTVSGMVRWLYDLYERTRDTAAVQFFMEANFMQDIILDEFEADGKTRLATAE